MSDETSGSRDTPSTPAYRSVSASSVRIRFTSSTVVFREVTNVMSAIDPTGIGARIAMPSNRPAYSGSARVVASAAPVEAGTRFAAAARPLRKLLLGPSTIDWDEV